MFKELRKASTDRLVGIETENHCMVGGQPKNSYFLTDNTKDDQHVVRNDSGVVLGTYHYDNALLECTTSPSPGGCNVTWYLDSVNYAFQNHLRLAHNLRMGFSPGQVWIDKTQIARKYLEEEMKETQFWIGGCDPSLNAYHSEGALSVPKYTSTERYGGYHINIDTCGEDHKDLARYLDRTLGLVDVLLSPTPSQGARRRKYYGRPGEYRTKEFGIEYRALPNNAAMHIRYLATIAGNLTDRFYKGTEKSPVWAADDASVEEAMMNYDKGLAAKLVAPYYKEIA